MADFAHPSLLFEMLERGRGGRGIHLYCLAIAMLQPGYADSLILLYADAAQMLRRCCIMLHCCKIAIRYFAHMWLAGLPVSLQPGKPASWLAWLA